MKSNNHRRNFLKILAISFLPKDQLLQAKDTSTQLENDKLNTICLETLKQLGEMPKRIHKDKIILNKEYIERIKGSFRNMPPEDIFPLLVLASAEEWDFLLLIWCVSNSPITRLTVLAIELTLRDSINMDSVFLFEQQSLKFIDKQSRIHELNFANNNLKSFAQNLFAIADLMNQNWAKTLKSLHKIYE